MRSHARKSPSKTNRNSCSATETKSRFACRCLRHRVKQIAHIAVLLCVLTAGWVRVGAQSTPPQRGTSQELLRYAQSLVDQRVTLEDPVRVRRSRIAARERRQIFAWNLDISACFIAVIAGTQGLRDFRWNAHQVGEPAHIEEALHAWDGRTGFAEVGACARDPSLTNRYTISVAIGSRGGTFEAALFDYTMPPHIEPTFVPIVPPWESRASSRAARRRATSQRTP